MARLKPEDFTHIRGIVEAAEKKTVGEIVPLVLKHASDYRWVHLTMAFYGLLLGIIMGMVLEYFHAFPVTAHELRFAAVMGGVLGLLFSFIPPIGRLAIGKDHLHREVEMRAFAEFIRQGCSATVGGTGVLVLVSLFEHRIVIVADHGVQKKVVASEGAGIWDSLCKDFSASAKSGKAIEGLGVVIERIGALMAKHFPGDGSDSNELSNDLRTES